MRGSDRGAGADTVTIALDNEYVRYEIGADGDNLRLVDKRTGADYCAPGHKIAVITKSGQAHPATAAGAPVAASLHDNHLSIEFGPAAVTAVINVDVQPRYFRFEVESVTGDGVEELVFANLHLTLQATPRESLACCALALNLQTNVPDLPSANKRLWAACCPRFGFAGAAVALIACPPEELRAVMQEVVSAAPELPHSPIGGPWALGQAINQGSYLFNFAGITQETVDDWIALAQRLGFDQVDFHGGDSFRFGDCRPNPKTYPRGFDSLKAVVDRLHGAGIKAGLHPYAFFIDKSCPWVTPVPDPRLAKDAAFTLEEPLGPKDDTVLVVEPTHAMSAAVGFFVRNSATLQVDDELITYTGVSTEPLFAFTGCQRGACGTGAADHAAGAKAHHLKECFGLFAPDGDSTLLAEVAARIAEAYNRCGFDMIYLDALDGEDVLGGRQWGWHYGSKFVFELWRRLQRPALMEMSTFHHHLWYVRSRMGAWDHPNRGHKRFIDIHVAANEENQRMFLPGQLGWWAVKTWKDQQHEPTFADDIEYLCCKALGTDSGLSLMGVDPQSIHTVPALARLAEVFRRYENLRRRDYFSASIKARLRRPGEDFVLEDAGGKWQLRPIRYDKHRVEDSGGWSNVWRVTNRYGRQPLQLRIEALLSAAPYDAPGNMTIADFQSAADFAERGAQSGVRVELVPSTAQVKVGPVSGCFSADSTHQEPRAAWANAVKVFPNPLDLSKHRALGVWVHGDGKGEVLNFQLRCPRHVVAGIGEHYVLVDFTGWRYFELIEPEAERYEDYRWPYGDAYAIYREPVDYSQVSSLGLWFNNVPAGAAAACYLSPIRAIPLVESGVRNPAVTVGGPSVGAHSCAPVRGGRTVVFPVEMTAGSYLEVTSRSDCKLYGRQGELICEVEPQGEVPVLEEGENEVHFACEAGDARVRPRARVTILTRGDPLRDFGIGT